MVVTSSPYMVFIFVPSVWVHLLLLNCVFVSEWMCMCGDLDPCQCSFCMCIDTYVSAFVLGPLVVMNVQLHLWPSDAYTHTVWHMHGINTDTLHAPKSFTSMIIMTVSSNHAAYKAHNNAISRNAFLTTSSVTSDLPHYSIAMIT